MLLLLTLTAIAFGFFVWLAVPGREAELDRLPHGTPGGPEPCESWPEVPDPADTDAEVICEFLPGTEGFTFRGHRISIEEINDYEQGPGLLAGRFRLDASKGGVMTRSRVAAALAWKISRGTH